MKISNIEFELNLHNTFELKNLRKYILENISKRGDVLRWSIDNIKIQKKETCKKVLTINAVVINK